MTLMKAISYLPRRHFRSLRPLVLALSLMPLAAQAAADVLEQTSAAFSRLAEKAMPGVVSIRVEKTVALSQAGPHLLPFNNPFESFGDDFLRRFFPGQGRGFGRQPEQRSFKQQGAGSGFLISKAGSISFPTTTWWAMPIPSP